MTEALAFLDYTFGTTIFTAQELFDNPKNSILSTVVIYIIAIRLIVGSIIYTNFQVLSTIISSFVYLICTFVHAAQFVKMLDRVEHVAKIFVAINDLELVFYWQLHTYFISGSSF